MYIILSGGKTMGHISPLISIYYDLKNKYDFIYVGLKDSMEEEVCKSENIPFIGLTLLPFYRRNLFKNFKTFYYIHKEKKYLRKLLVDYKIEKIITSGGFVSIPVLLAYKSDKSIKKELIELNTELGLANKLLSRYVNTIITQFPLKNKKAVVKRDLIKINRISSFDHPFFYLKKKLILFVGGSNGAYDIVNLAYDFHLAYPSINCVVLTSKKYQDLFKFESNAFVIDRIVYLNSIMSKFDLIVTRAGGATIAELWYSKVPYILYPSPNVSNNHQYKNAIYLNKTENIGVITNKSLNKERYIFDYLMKK